MTLPNDGLTLSEVRAVNGAPTVYKMNEPVPFEDFKAWPADIQAEYLKALQEKYNANYTDIAHMMGAKRKEFDEWRKIALPEFAARKLGRARPGAAWDAFCKSATWALASDWTPPEREAEDAGKRAQEDPPAPETPVAHAPGNRPAVQLPGEPISKSAEAQLKDALAKLKPECMRAKDTIKPTTAELEQLFDLLPILRAAGAKIRIEVEL